jgi:hypothetical protein
MGQIVEHYNFLKLPPSGVNFDNVTYDGIRNAFDKVRLRRYYRDIQCWKAY